MAKSTETLVITLPAKTRDWLYKAAPKGRRSKFVADLIEEKMREEAREELMRLLAAMPRAPHPQTEDSLTALRAVRAEMCGEDALE